ncbi:uncharacterized protein LOC119741252 [Patiria miniata]|uniref:YqaJ viral recombinase domain-containing protein n=1 Tax=Patiria miniata TaxID=46514 RepID=A0A914BBX4_PATMI|nr:uncharacterized protein LOC119741252 [Patiria miniata]
MCRFAYKQNRLTSSNFGAVLGAVRRNSTPSSLLKTLRGEYGSAGRSSAIQWGVNHEDITLEKYSALGGCDVQPTGLFIMDNGQLGASPDGQVSKDLIVEVKCPWSARATPLIELAMKKDFFLFNDPTAAPGMLKLKETHKYWHQGQGALHITGATAYDFFVWTPTEYHCIRIQKDPKWASNIPILTQFHRKVLLPTVLGS